jgi:site-specific DNA recombinase
MRAVIYARYSTDRQREASIDDQIRLCRKRIAQQGWQYRHAYTDRAMSAASTMRPAYQTLLEDARHGQFEIVVAEALDRLSRDQEDVAGLFKRLQFAGIRLFTLAEGEISELHVGLKGTMNALFLKDLADKTRRGLEGRVREGRSGGGLCFGYDVVRQTDARGEPIHGGRAINPAEAAIVTRIFELFRHGQSPRAIAHLLNPERVPGPGGRPWGDTTIRGHHERGTGILRNELYIGRLVWNRLRYLKDPATGKRRSRLNPPSAWIVEDVSALRIIDQPLWEAVQQRLLGIRDSESVRKARATRFWEHRRAKHLLTDKTFCGVCGNPLRAHREVNRQRQGAELQRSTAVTELASVSRKLEGLVEAIADGLRAPGLQRRLDELETRKVALEANLAASPPASVRLHPNLAQLYREKVAQLHLALADPATRAEALELTRKLIQRVEVHPAERGFRIDLVGEIANMVQLSAGAESLRSEAERSSVKVVAGTRNHRQFMVIVAV